MMQYLAKKKRSMIRGFGKIRCYEAMFWRDNLDTVFWKDKASDRVSNGKLCGLQEVTLTFAYGGKDHNDKMISLLPLPNRNPEPSTLEKVNEV